MHIKIANPQDVLSHSFSPPETLLHLWRNFRNYVRPIQSSKTFVEIWEEMMVVSNILRQYRILSRFIPQILLTLE